MTKFALQKISLIKGRVPFTKLEVDGVCLFDKFCEEIEKEGNLSKQITTIYARMEQIANLQLLPKEKCRNITPKKESIKEFEIKTSDLRVYLIKEENHIIILGGKKSTQKEDLSKFRSIKNKYLKFKKKQS